MKWIVVTDEYKQAFISIVISKLCAAFVLNQVGVLNYFLGVQVNHLPNRAILLSQTRPIYNLEIDDMAKARSISNPMVRNCKLEQHISKPNLNWSIGVLQFSTLTRPETSFSVNKVHQFLSQRVLSCNLVSLIDLSLLEPLVMLFWGPMILMIGCPTVHIRFLYFLWSKK